ncbi:MAG TPA: DUF362 domain-containing protein [Clostridia bacterium]|nr:DUF362 domain-containing protein [Clostridia bacterium]
MKNLFLRLQRKILLNLPVTKRQGQPILKNAGSHKKLVLKGPAALDDFNKEAHILFSDYDSSDRVLIKVNLNSGLPFPASVSLDMLKSLILLLNQLGIKNITVADCSGLTHLPTSKNMKTKELYSLRSNEISVRTFDFGRWRNVPVKGQYHKHIIIPEIAYKVDRIINLSNLKSHRLAGHSGPIKNLVGFMHPRQRYQLHEDHLVERIAEIPLALVPNINIVDARRIFVDGGPDYGKEVPADMIIAGTDLIDIESEAYNLLIDKRKQYNIAESKCKFEETLLFKHYSKIHGGSI